MQTGRVDHIAWRQYGEPIRLLLLHGFSDSAECWEPLVPEFARYGGILATDARGHGDSGLPLEPTGAKEQAQDHFLVLDRLGITGPIVLIGHSMGAVTAMAVAAARPDLVAALVLEDPPPHARKSDRSGVPPWLSRLRELSLDDRIARGRAQNPTWPAADLPSWANAKAQLDARFCDLLTAPVDPGGELLPSITCPALLLYGDPELGGMVTSADAVRFESLSAGPLTSTQFPGAGHSIRREARADYLRVVHNFLSSLP